MNTMETWTYRAVCEWLQRVKHSPAICMLTGSSQLARGMNQ